MKKIICCLTLLSCLQSFAQQDTLLYKDYLDYYNPYVKSTILDKDLQFLKDGQYTFKGSKEDFSFLLQTYIKPYYVEKMEISAADTLYFSGEIKDSLKVKKWRLYRKQLSTETTVVKESSFNGLDFRDGTIRKYYSEIDGGKYIMAYHKDFISFGIRSYVIHNTYELTERVRFKYAKKSDSINYIRRADFLYKDFEYTVYQSSEDLHDSMETAITFSNFDPKKESYNEYSVIIKEHFKNKKLIAMTIRYSDVDSNNKHFEKLVNYSSLLGVISGDLYFLKPKPNTKI